MSEENFYFEFAIPQRFISDSVQLEKVAFSHNSSGMEEFSLVESQVDEILGERSYSGGDLPVSVLDEVEATITNQNEKLFKVYFLTEKDALCFQKEIEECFNYLPEVSKKEIQDWNDEWRKHYNPIWISEELEIVPAWDNSHDSNSRKQLYIYPGMGFGTGSHETTYLCLKSFVEQRNRVEYKRCLDFGCGSGILGLAIQLFNSTCTLDLYDIDPEAINNCIQNIELNKFEQNPINLYGPDKKESIQGQYDIVFANILLNVLLFERDLIVNSVAPKGILILSGLLKGQEVEVIKNYQNYNSDLILISVDQKNDWVSVTFEKNQ
jgi:ribosomal protein L11 methyltransferase